MSGSLGKSSSKNSSGGNFGESVWGGQEPYLQDMYGAAGNLFNQSSRNMGKMAPGASSFMNNIAQGSVPAWQQQMGGGAFQGMDLQGMYGDALQGGGNEQFMNESIMGGAGNNYVDAMKGQMQQDSDKRLGGNLAMNDARAAGYQQSGSSRHGITERGIYDESENNLGRMQTQLGYETFDKDLDRKMGIAQRADQFDMGKLQNVGNMLGQKQNAMAGGLGAGKGMQQLGMGQFAPQMAPWQAMQGYGNAIGDPTVLGSGSMMGRGKSKGFGIGKG